MTRKKVKLAFINNDASRKATYKKRKKGLMKKVNELSTLCGIDACAIIYSPYDSQPEVWPNTMGVQRVLAQFKRMPEMEQSKKMMNQESFTKQRIAKANEQLKKQIRDNREKEMTEVMYQCLTGKLGLHNLMLPDLNDLVWLIEQKVKEINKSIDEITKKNGTHEKQVVTSATDNIGVLATDVSEEQNSAADLNTNLDNGGLVQRPHWFNELVINNNVAATGQNSGFGRDEEEMFATPFGDANNTMWSSAFFP
ncbi:agamous-like MADS-box protein AGL80 [Heracleum sosnowskyi]|uniref:Agamous-like MADS-box protein AGL80 n=1 Tax=Heracleum sosnowskyi TaxID=360622 RepID=A0AAD8IQM8_9APIA|nr:agamous-like MADS-box protein AGL80 [Heracleum sosnowskyi]